MSTSSDAGQTASAYPDVPPELGEPWRLQPSAAAPPDPTPELLASEVRRIYKETGQPVPLTAADVRRQLGVGKDKANRLKQGLVTERRVHHRTDRPGVAPPALAAAVVFCPGHNRRNWEVDRELTQEVTQEVDRELTPKPGSRPGTHPGTQPGSRPGTHPGSRTSLHRAPGQNAGFQEETGQLVLPGARRRRFLSFRLADAQLAGRR